MKRRWPLILLAAVLVLISIAVVVTIFSAGSIEGAVPGKAPLLGLAVAGGSYIVASETGLYVSPDGKRWSRPAAFAQEPALVTGLAEGGAVVLSAGRLLLSDGSGRFREFLPGGVSATAIASSNGAVYLAQGSRAIRAISGYCVQHVSRTAECTETGLSGELRVAGGPDELLALDVVPGDPPLFFAGGLRSGVWRSSDPEQRWVRVLQTAARAIMVDDRDPKRIFLGTAGGVLVSKDQGLSWAFTGMRQPVEALAQGGARFFALAADRLVYGSSDGEVWRAEAAR